MATIIFLLTFILYNVILVILTSFWLLPLWLLISYLLAFITVLLIYYLHIPLVVVLKPTHRYKTYLLKSMSVFLNRFIFGLDITYDGIENIPKDGRLVAYANHKSYSDAFSVLQIFNRAITFTPKSSVSRLPLVSVYLKSYGAFYIDRKNVRDTAKSLHKAIETVKSEMAMLIFPQGSVKQREDDSVNLMKPGSFKIALKAEATILPIKITGSDRIRDRFPFKRTKRKVQILSPIPFDEYKMLNTIEIADLVTKRMNSI